ncbi:MAG: molybdenum cofactor guanylyltransferase, partial [Kiritimatiellota bacterium]|nr:molybdenum cofactor guanylyltransferase [Kiritimatiellota bacterium]
HAAGMVKRVLRRDEDRAGIVMEMLRTWLTEKWLSTPVYAGILIGGESLRMGRPKHLITTSTGRTWIEMIIESIQPLVNEVVLLGKGKIPKPLEGLPVLPDIEDMQGPLAGILSAMRWRPDVSWLFLSCDMPQITTDALRWLLANRKPGVWAILPCRTKSCRWRDKSEVYPPTVATEVYQAESMATRGVEPLPGWYDFRALRLLETCRGPAGLAGHAQVATPLIPAEIAAAWTNVNTVPGLDAVMPFLDNA